MHISMIMRRGKVLISGKNDMKKTHPKALALGFKEGKIHSEFRVIMKAKRLGIDMRRCVLINVRYKKDGSIGNSKPCECCQRLINEVGIRRVIHS